MRLTDKAAPVTGSTIGPAALAKFGRLDVVVNNAGLMQFKPPEQLTGDDWLRILSVDFLGAFHFTR